jgi:hypothetical protein
MFSLVAVGDQLSILGGFDFSSRHVHFRDLQSKGQLARCSVERQFN